MLPASEQNDPPRTVLPPLASVGVGEGVGTAATSGTGARLSAVVGVPEGTAVSGVAAARSVAVGAVLVSLGAGVLVALGVGVAAAVTVAVVVVALVLAPAATGVAVPLGVGASSGATIPIPTVPAIPRPIIVRMAGSIRANLGRECACHPSGMAPFQDAPERPVRPFRYPNTWRG